MLTCGYLSLICLTKNDFPLPGSPRIINIILLTLIDILIFLTCKVCFINLRFLKSVCIFVKDFKEHVIFSAVFSRYMAGKFQEDFLLFKSFATYGWCHLGSFKNEMYMEGGRELKAAFFIG